MEVFKVPSNVPQDLQFIQDIIGELPPPAPVQKPSTPPPSTVSHDENIDSSDSDADSEKEVEADILTGIAEDEDDEKKDGDFVFDCGHGEALRELCGGGAPKRRLPQSFADRCVRIYLT